MPNLSISNFLELFMAVMLAWASVNVILSVIRLNRTYELTPSRFIYPADCKPELCRDPAGFIRFMTPRLWIFGLLGLALCALLLLSEFTDLLSGLPFWFSNGVSLILFLPIFLWYVIFINKAAKRFW